MIWIKIAYTIFLFFGWLALLFSHTTLGLAIGYITLLPVAVFTSINVANILDYFYKDKRIK